MPMIVANNLNALSTGIALDKNNAKLGVSLERLSTGYKINSGKDDPSGLVISEQLRAQNVGLERAVQNTQEANNVLGIAEGALNEMNNILSKMRQLAVHSANNGVTSPEQVAADQSEIDSSVQTLDRIARTTKFSDQFLLNGNKELNYDSTVQMSDSNDHKLLNEKLSDIKQIFKKDDFKLNISFSGSIDSGTSSIKENGNEAQKGYFEITKGKSSATEVITGKTGSEESQNYTLSADQAFTISGNEGSRYLTFAQGTHLGEMVSSINSVSDSTGVEATLIYDSTATVTETASAGTQAIGTTAHASGSADVFNISSIGEITTAGATAIDVGDASNIKLGQNVDGYGRVYLKMIDDDSYEIFKDEDMTMKVAEGDISSNSSKASAANNSGLNGLTMSFSSDVSAGMTSVIQLGVFQEAGSAGTETVNFDELALASSTAGSTSNTQFISSGSYLSGIKLGENTDETGKLYIKADLKDGTDGGEGKLSQIFVYKDARMRDEDLVAQSDKVDLTSDSASGNSLRLYGIETATSGETSGLYGTLNFNMGTATQDIEFTTTISSENLGVRLSSEDYGSDDFVKIDVEKGEIFSTYNEQNEAELLGAGDEITSYGRDATISLNGQELKLDGISGEVANLDTAATLVMNQGSLGCTTVAAVGYDEGAWGSRAYQMADSEDNYINHAIKSTTETLGDWSGGMQFQLGEGSGDQERTVFSLKDVTATELGKTLFTDKFGGNTDTEKFLSINDMLSGGLASLAEDPVKALEIIDQAIDDVSSLRADIGAFQSNMLETNASSLNVAIENITKTESYIRDADMAQESTEFTSNQIMVQAGTAMLSQANALQQNALSLIG